MLGRNERTRRCGKCWTIHDELCWSWWKDLLRLSRNRGPIKSCIMEYLRIMQSIERRFCRSIDEYEQNRNGRNCRERMGGRVDILPGHNCCGEVLVFGDGFVPIVVEWCDCEQLRSIHQPRPRFWEDWVWVWGELVLRDHHDLWVGELCRFVWVGYLWFLERWNCPEFGCDFGFFVDEF